MMSLKRVCDVQLDFIDAYFLEEPYDRYTSGCSVSELKTMLSKEKYHPNINHVTLDDGESPEDFCLYVTFRKIPPDDVPFPVKFKGVRVFYDVIGDVKVQ